MNESNEVYLATFTLFFTPEADILMPRFTGNIVLSSLLVLISKVDAKLAKRLHASKEVKPYSCTPIYPKSGEFRLPPKRSVTHLRRSKVYQVRMALITDTLIEKFMKAITNEASKEWALKFMGVRCPIINVSAHIRAFDEIKPKFLSELVKVRFLTPTRFAVKSTVRRPRPKFRLFPIPENLFHSLVHHWNYFAPENLKINESQLYEYVLNYVVEDDYKIHRESVEIGKGRKAIGFIGYCTYRFDMLEHPMFKTCMKLLSYGELINVGNAKSMGLGVIRVEKFIK